MTGIELDPEILQVAKEMGLDDNDLRDVMIGDFMTMDADTTYPGVISNPPYIPKNEMPELMEDVRDFEPEIALTDFADGLTFYKRLVKILPNIISRKSLLVLEVGIGNHPDNVLSILKESGYSDIKIINDYNGDRRVFRIKIKN